MKNSGENENNYGGNADSNGKSNAEDKSQYKGNTSLKGYVVALVDDDFNIMDHRFWTAPTYALVYRVFKDIRIDWMKGTDFLTNLSKGFVLIGSPLMA